MDVVEVPMIFNNHEEAFDIAAIREIIKDAQTPASKVILPKLPFSIKDTVTLYSNAAITLGSRHHSMVLSVTNATLTIAVVYDEYYYMKHKGVSDEYEDLVVLVNIADADLVDRIRLTIDEFIEKQVR
tara:strand:+ start:257 stop:640 length:384 start_codon:yes stop_codon:yes gene_type:complete